MKLMLEIESENAAFDDANEELARILTNLADDLRCYSDHELSGMLKDINGNRVGSFMFTTE